MKGAKFGVDMDVGIRGDLVTFLIGIPIIYTVFRNQTTSIFGILLLDIETTTMC